MRLIGRLVGLVLVVGRGILPLLGLTLFWFVPGPHLKYFTPPKIDLFTIDLFLEMFLSVFGLFITPVWITTLFTTIVVAAGPVGA